MTINDLLTEATVTFRDSSTTRNKATSFLGQYFSDGEIAPVVKDKVAMNALVAFIAKEAGIKLVKGSYTITDKTVSSISSSVFDHSVLPPAVKKALGIKSSTIPKKKITMATATKSTPEPEKVEPPKPKSEWSDEEFLNSMREKLSDRLKSWGDNRNNFDVSIYKAKDGKSVTVEFDCTDRRTTKVDLYNNFRSVWSNINDYLERFKDVTKKSLYTLDAAREASDRWEANEGSAYSEYEMSASSFITFTI